MKEIRIALEDKEYRQLKKIKGKMTWKQFLFENGERDERRDKNNKS